MRILTRTEAAVERRRLAELERKERAHDAYMAASRKMGDAATPHIVALADGTAGDYSRGWLACLTAFGTAVMDAGREP